MANLKVQVIANSFLGVETQIIVNAANSHALMAGEMAGSYRKQQDQK